MKFRSILFSVVGSSVLATGLLSVSASEASALDLANGSTTCSLGNLTGSTQCEGAFDGNDSNQDLSDLFGTNVNWTEVVKIDTQNGQTSYSDGDLSFDFSQGDNEGKSGTWDFTGFNANEQYMFVLKGGPTFSAYLMDGLTASGNWNTDGILTGGNNPKPGPGLSHFTVYSTPSAAEPVPEPFTILGSATALGVGALLKRKADKKAS